MQTGKIVKTFKTKKGSTAVIRYPKWEDLDDMLSFANALSKEDTFVQLSGETLGRDEEITYISKVLSDMERGKTVHCVVYVGKNFAANAGVNIDSRRKKHVGTIHISVAREFREEGIGKILLETLIEEAKKMKLRLLTLTCLENNDRALHVYESVGFKKAGVIPKAIFYHGSYVGEVQMYLPLTEIR